MADPYTPYTAAPTASPYANWGLRVAAYLIDIAPIVIIDVIFFRISFVVGLLLSLAALGWTIYNRWYQAGTTGQSLGKKVLHLRLVSDQSGEPIGALMAFVRDICHFVDAVICYVGFLFPLWDAKRQTIADKIVGTVVIPDGTS